MSNMRGFDAAQRAYDNATPPDDGPCECPDCDGTGNGWPTDPDAPHGEREACECCKGSGYVNEDGTPHDPQQAQRDADEAADMKRNEQENDHG